MIRNVPILFTNPQIPFIMKYKAPDSYKRQVWTPKISNKNGQFQKEKV